MKFKSINYCKILVLFAVQCMPFLMNGQVTFQKVYPTTYDKTSRDILPTSDGGYIIAGSTNNSTLNDCDVYVMKTDNMGNKIWEYTYGGSLPDYTYAMVETSDGNYFIVGFTQSFGGGDFDVYLLKIDPSGNMIWQKDLGDWGNQEARDIIKTSDGNYVITGSSTTGGNGQDAFLMKVDLSGNILWTKYYGWSNKETTNSVKQCTDGGFILTGETLSSGASGRALLVRTDANGDTLWTRRYGTSLDDEGICVVQNSDAGFTFVVRDSTAAKDIDVRVMKTDANGNVVFDKIYGGNVKDTPKSICTTADGGYLIGAISRSFGWVNPDMWILKLNGGGDTLWSHHFGSSDHEHCHKAKEWDNGYIAVGHARSYGPGQKVMFVKMNSAGVVGINEYARANNNFNVYPNPSEDGWITISGENNSPVSVKLTNSMGQLIYAAKPDHAGSINLGERQRGVYLLTIESQNGISTRKIIIGK